MTKPHQSPNTATVAATGSPPSLGWRWRHSVVALLIGVSFLFLLNGQVFTNTIIFLICCGISLFVWLPPVLPRPRHEHRRLAFYVILGHLVVMVFFAVELPSRYRYQQKANAIRVNRTPQGVMPQATKERPPQ